MKLNVLRFISFFFNKKKDEMSFRKKKDDEMFGS